MAPASNGNSSSSTSTHAHPAKLEVFCDFDGTISQQDVTDLLLERLAEPAWLDIERKWQDGQISSRECMARQIPLMRGGWEALFAVADEATLDPGFKSFCQWCHQNQIKVHVVSEGLDKVIQRLFAREGVEVDTVVANELNFDEQTGFSLNMFHPAGPRFERHQGCGGSVCKCALLERSQSAPARTTSVVIGDGRSDFCWSRKADMLFAKGKLEKHLAQHFIPYTSFSDFFEIQAHLANYLAGQTAQRPSVALTR